MSTEVEFVDGTAVHDAIKDVRNDTTPTDWMLARHCANEIQHVELAGSGSGGVDELVANLDDATVMYGLLRVTEKIDLSTTVKFVYIYFSGEQVPFQKRGRMGVVHGSVRKHFSVLGRSCLRHVGRQRPGDATIWSGADGETNQPFHCDFDITRKDELNATLVQRKVAETRGASTTIEHPFVFAVASSASGTVDLVREGHNPRNAQRILEGGLADISGKVNEEERNFTGMGSSVGKGTGKHFNYVGTAPEARQSVGLEFHPDVSDAIKDVRNDSTATNWCVAGYEDNDPRKPIALLAKGDDGLAGLHAQLTPESIAYGLYRTTDVIDGHETVKFVFISFIGGSVGTLKRAKLSIHKGALVDKFSPFHVQFDVSAVSEISQMAVMDKVQAASGSRNWVR